MGQQSPGAMPQAEPGKVPAARSGGAAREAAVEKAERTACRGLFCVAAKNLCIEPDPQSELFDYVGQGNGVYKQVQNFSYVGQGVGAWEKVERSAPSAWRVKPTCKWLFLAAVVTTGAVLGWSSYSGRGREAPKQQAALHNGDSETAPGNTGDCSDGDVSEWPSDKRKWCCTWFAKGCSDARASPPPAASKSGTPSPPVLPTGVASSIRYDCKAGLSNWQWGWSMGKKDWCCEHEQKGCPETVGPDADKVIPQDPYDCEEDYQQWQGKWTIGKRAWCCKHENKACPDGYVPEKPTRLALAPYDCTAGEAEKHSWSVGKQAWCCNNKQIGCSA